MKIIWLIILTLASIEDVRKQRIFIGWPVLAIVIGAFGNLFIDRNLVDLALGLLVGGIFLATSIISKEKMGLGDGVMILGAALYLSTERLLGALILAGVGTLGAFALLYWRKNRVQSLPFLPFFWGGSVAVLWS